MNRNIKLLIISDVFVLTGFGLIEPIFALFMEKNVIGGSIFNVGLASTLFLITKSLFLILFSKHLDKSQEKIRWLIVGTVLITLVPFIYIFANNVNYIFIAQIVYGIGSALAYPTWFNIWVSNIDKSNTGFDWSIYSALTGVGTALSALIGAAIAQLVGFIYTFLIVGLMSLVGCVILVILERKIKGKQTAILKFSIKNK